MCIGVTSASQDAIDGGNGWDGGRHGLIIGPLSRGSGRLIFKQFSAQQIPNFPRKNGRVFLFEGENSAHNLWRGNVLGL